MSAEMEKEKKEKYDREKNNIGKLLDACKQGDLNKLKEIVKMIEQDHTSSDGPASSSSSWSFHDTLFGYKDAEGRGVLHFASTAGSIDIIKYLLSDSKDKYKDVIDSKDKEGMTPVMVASASGWIDIVKLFVEEYKASLTLTTNSGANALHYASGSGCSDIIQYILSKKVLDINSSSSAGTAVHWAAGGGHIDSLKILLEQGKADPNAKDNHGFTPLVLACVIGHPEVTLILLNHGADPKILSKNDGEIVTALLVSASMGRIECIRVLLDAMSKEDQIDQANIKDSEGYVGSLAAAKAGHYEISDLLVPLTKQENFPQVERSSLWTGKELAHQILKMETEAKEELKRKCQWAETNAETQKTLGNKYFEEKRLPEAIDCFTKGIDDCINAGLLKLIDQETRERHEREGHKAKSSHGAVQTPRPFVALLANRSLCYLDVGRVDDALKDAELAVRLEPMWPKALYRAGMCYMKKKMYVDASEAFWKGYELDPKSKNASQFRDYFTKCVQLGKEENKIQTANTASQQDNDSDDDE